jgi:hypothetical protein
MVINTRLESRQLVALPVMPTVAWGTPKPREVFNLIAASPVLQSRFDQIKRGLASIARQLRNPVEANLNKGPARAIVTMNGRTYTLTVPLTAVRAYRGHHEEWEDLPPDAQIRYVREFVLYAIGQGYSCSQTCFITVQLASINAGAH